ncbi:basic secretory protein-like protein [Desertivirga arenae]|uniref:basic secretory protein-like protein n=1 Tax=Desertivirga arenae TaxID=2810309 RepID=UPI001A96F718|nr:basic secretory protein-like protein [Pedobacter sp. SYSU D00823]
MLKIKFKQTLFSIFLSFIGFSALAQDNWEYIDRSKIAVSDTTKKGKYTLVFVSMQPDFSESVTNRLKDVFFEVYPKEAKMYNKNTTDSVFFVIDPGYDGVAAAAGRTIRFNPAWFDKNPGDIDVVTHEVMHLVQSYPGGAGPGWVTEGIADYVRLTMGVDNKGAGWSVPDYKASQSYTNAYRITARFFYWMEKNVKKGLVKKLDNAMRTKTYSDSFWKDQTGKTIDELWSNYGKNPVI